MKKINYISIHGFKGGPELDYHRFLQKKLLDLGYQVAIPTLPNPNNPIEKDQIKAVMGQCAINDRTVIIAHSLGCAVALKMLMNTQTKIHGLVLVAPVIEERFRPDEIMNKAYWEGFSIAYDYKRIMSCTQNIIVVSDRIEYELRGEYCEFLAESLGARLDVITANRKHITGYEEPYILAVAKEFIV